MKVIGITGGVGCGKSQILSELVKIYNCTVLLADDAAKLLEKKGNDCYFKLVELLGEDILDENGEIIPALMSKKIFSEENLLKKVNDIIHPAVRNYIIDSIESYKKEGNIEYFFLEAALLIECGYLTVVDEMWYIFAQEEVRRERLKKSRGYSDEKIDSIMKSQLSDSEFRNNCVFVVDNSFSIENSMMQIAKRLA